MDLTKLRKNANIHSDKELAKIIGVTERTIKNWKKKKPPLHAVNYLKLRSGDLSHIDESWKGFIVNKDSITSNKGNFIYPFEIDALNFLYLSAGINRTNLCLTLMNNQSIQSCVPKTLKKEIEVIYKIKLRKQA